MSDMLDTGVNASDTLTYIRFWLDAISLYAPGAPVCLVGTHRDQVQLPPPRTARIPLLNPNHDPEP